MLNPQYVYYLAIGAVVLMEAGCGLFGRRCFGRMAYVLGAAFAASYAGYAMGQYLPAVQLVVHIAGFALGMVIARGLAGHVIAGIFFPMVTVDALRLWELVSPMTWWWAIYYMAMAQLVALGMGAEFHPLGRAIRRLSAELHARFERSMGWI
ncbi:hypothetical protein [Sphingomonas baiyangensis]|uniref:Uncharacterized protein n=1 Tax=Sphingomonas baiyangensis TaxID=2572576 RepID=A0A4U1L0U6_9SPHN|nr:hypothetical protein [Sphingomonas baiyangensis]TKD50232.1 hypothetical protein FBR43_05275 [Sphingomonas baiyangensis]